MCTLYIENPDMRLRLEQGQILLETPNETGRIASVQKVSLRRLDRVVLLGRAHITIPAMAALLEAGIPLCLHNRQGMLLGRLAPRLGKHVQLRREQYRRFEDDATALPYATATVAAKLRNQRRVLQRLRRNQPQSLPACNTAIALLAQLEDKARQSETPASLLGLEGSGARAYWQALAERLALANVEFPGRHYHPCTDAVNALLSYGYALLTARMASALESAGLDPYFGFFHQPEYGRESLALDLIEPLRPVLVDRLVLKLFQRQQLSPKDFEHATDKSIQMKSSARRVFLEAWENHHEKVGLHGILRQQSENLSKSLRDNNVDWTPYPWSERP